MKKNIHPEYHKDCQVTCSCGNVFTVAATQPKMKIEVCSQCHPFYSGEQRIVDTAGQVERFRKRYKLKD